MTGKPIAPRTVAIMRSSASSFTRISASSSSPLESGAGTTLSWTVKVYAMCIEQVFGLYDGYNSSPINSSDKGVGVSCPANWQMVGAGGQISTPDAGKVFCFATGPSKEAVMRIHERTGHPTTEVFELKIEV